MYLTNPKPGSEPVIAEGMTASQWVSLLQTPRAQWAAKSLNYLDGLQLEELQKLLDDPQRGRKKWKERGFIPRTRNLTKAIIEKSAQLFCDCAPELAVWRDKAEQMDTDLTQRFMDEMHKVDWVEFFNNVDQVTRLLKTSIVLVQWDNTEKTLVLDVLHRGNCEVVINPATRKISSLIQRFASESSCIYYRIWSPDKIIDLKVDDGKEPEIINTEDNTLGCVPAAVFYDTAPPRSGFWVEAPHDLVGMNEMVNLHITDSEWSAAFAKRPTPITNMTFKSQEETPEVMSTQPWNSALPRLGTTPGDEITTGPDTIIQLNSRGVDGPFFKYEAPSVNFAELDQMVKGWIESYASDWSVQIRAAGAGTASSGFQLIVEELPNLELRKKRAKQFEAGFKRFFHIVSKVMNRAMGMEYLPETACLYATFEEPNLPVNQKEAEEIWDKKIAGGRASIIDYLMVTEELTEEEAIARYEKIKMYQALTQAAAAIQPLVQPPVEVEIETEDEDEEDDMEDDSEDESDDEDSQNT